MNPVTFNGNTILLDDDLLEYEIKKGSETYIIYSQFLNQLHLPSEKWSFYKGNKGLILIEKRDELEELDEIVFKSFDYSKIVSVTRLYLYYLLQLYLGNSRMYTGIGVLRDKKSHFLYLNTSFQLANMRDEKFETNSISRFLFKRAKKKELLQMHDTFFVLLDEKFKSKLLNALTLYQSETGAFVSKSDWVENVVNKERLAALERFSKKQIESL